MHIHFRRIKILFFCIVVLLAAGLTLGSLAMRSVLQEGEKWTVNTAEFLGAKYAYAQSLGQSLPHAVWTAVSRMAVQAETAQPAASVPVLLYHGIITEADGDNILVNDFRNQMFALKQAGWQTVSIQDFYEFILGRKTLPDKSFLLTFDDGRKDSYRQADPILRALNYHAVMFTITGHSLDTDVESTHYLDKQEVKAMLASGRWDIQSHSRYGHQDIITDESGAVGHFYGNKQWLPDQERHESDDEFSDRVSADLSAAKSDIQRELGYEPVSFAFPYGDYVQGTKTNFPGGKTRLLSAVQAAYPLAFYQWGRGDGFSSNFPTDPNFPRFLYNRIGVGADWSGDHLLDILNRSSAKDLPYQEDFAQASNWINSWGSLSIQPGSSMTLSASTDSTGGAILLDGSYLWRDYEFHAIVDGDAGQAYILKARYVDSKNYVDCQYSKNSLILEQYLDGKRIDLQEVPGNYFQAGKSHIVSIEVHGTHASCSAYGKEIISSSAVADQLDHGGVAVEIWDPQANNSKLLIQNLTVTPVH